ncbi:MAG: hypothetical protein RIF34_07565, partial [Candidatus Kapaibacterium sp.]
MSPNTMTGSKEHSGAGFVQWVVFLAITLVVGYVTHFHLLPRATAAFVISQFSPSGDDLGKIGFVEFDNLTWGSTSKEKEASIGSNTTVAKDLINGEYIIDFSWQDR